MRQVHLVRIHGEDLRLAVAPLDLQREKRLLRFPAKADVAAVQKKISGKLHGDGAGTTGSAAPRQVAQRRGKHAREVDAPVLFEVLVLNGGDRVMENFGALFVGHQDAALQGEATHELTVIGVDFRDHVRAVGFERANFRQIAGINEQQSAGCAKQDGAEKKEGQRDAVNQLETAQSQRDRREAQHENIILTHKRSPRTTHTNFDAMNEETNPKSLIVESTSNRRSRLQICSMNLL